MANSIKPEKLADELEKRMQAIVGVTEDAAKASVDEVARRTVSELVATSPKGRRVGHPYSKSWKVGQKPRVNNYTKVIYSASPEYRLTHLLEFGHATRSGGRTKAQPHIAPAEKKAVEDYFNTLKRKIENGLV